jgi:hypothetical protein
VGLLVITGVACYLLFEFLRGLIRGEVPCVGKACRMLLYTLTADAADYWANMFFLAWMVLGLSYAAYVTLKIWIRA